MLWSRIRLLIALSVAAILVMPSRGAAQANACVDPDGVARIARAVGLSAQELDRIARGEIVVRQIAAPDRDEIALLGAVSVASSRDVVAARAMQRFTYRSRDGRRAGGRFGSPPSLVDVRDLPVDPSDVDAVKTCRPGDCNVKLPARAMMLFQSSIDWNAPHPELAAAAIARARLVDYVARYRRVGDAALVEYDDQSTPAPARVAAQTLLGETAVLRDEAPALYEFMRRYPAEAVSGIRDEIDWSIDQLPGLRPITSVTHIAAYEQPNGEAVFIVGKQLYASHYFEGMFDTRIVMSDPEAPGRAAYIVVRRMLFDHLPSGGILNTRGRAISRLRDGLAAELQEMRDWANRATP